nr:immunoglobulin heavy chain junction region [Mus musculus]
CARHEEGPSYYSNYGGYFDVW